jgi:hypothetical protein
MTRPWALAPGRLARAALVNPLTWGVVLLAVGLTAGGIALAGHHRLAAHVFLIGLACGLLGQAVTHFMPRPWSGWEERYIAGPAQIALAAGVLLAERNAPDWASLTAAGIGVAGMAFGVISVRRFSASERQHRQHMKKWEQALMDPTSFRNEMIARVCHEANRGLQIAFDDPAPSPPWDEASEFQRQSTREGVTDALAGSTPEELHYDWCEHRVAAGWRHGPLKDEAAKTHPCLVAYDDLPAEQRLKDELFVAIVRTLAGSGGDVPNDKQATG